jgi:hypothetical protein
MGHLNDPLNTFWELFYRPAGGSSWTLVTPRGVADNGGLVMSAELDHAVTVGFLPDQNLLFSPLAQTSDDGSSWSPGLIADALLSAPDVLAGAEGGRSYALVRSDGGRVLAGSAYHPAAWRTLVTRKTLARTAGGRSCGVGKLTALTVDESGQPLVGTTCTEGDRAGIFEATAGRWALVGPRIPGRSDSTTSNILRLVVSGTAMSSLVAIDSGGHVSIVATWRDGGSGPWAVSPALATARSARIVSTADDPGGGFLVQTTQANGSTILAAVAGEGASWRTRGVPPVTTTDVAAGPDGAVDALSVRNSTLTVWALNTPTGSWRKTQTIDVPIDYGSSD